MPYLPYLPNLPYLPFVEVLAAFCPTDFVGAQLFATNSLDSQHFDNFDERSQGSDFISGPPTSGIPLRLDEDEFFQGPSGSSFLTDLDPGMHSDTTMPQGMGTGGRVVKDPAVVKEEETHLSSKELLFVADEVNKPTVAAVGKRRVRKAEKPRIQFVSPNIAGSKRRTEGDDRSDKRPSLKRARRSVQSGETSSSKATSSTASYERHETSTKHEGNTLKQNTSKSSVTDLEDGVPKDRSLLDNVQVSAQGHPPSQSTAPEWNMWGPRQAPFMSTEFNCFDCKEGFYQKPEWKQHFRTDKHARQVAQIKGIKGKVKGPKPFKCQEQDCTSAFGRNDELIRHRRSVHKIVIELPRKKVKETRAKEKKAKEKKAKTKTKVKVEETKAKAKAKAKERKAKATGTKTRTARGKN